MAKKGCLEVVNKCSKQIFCTVLSVIIMTVLSGCSFTNKKKTVKLTWWIDSFPHVKKVSERFEDNPFYKELMKRNNVEIEFIHPNNGMDLESLNAMDKLPDIIEGNFYNYPGGPQKAIEDGIIISLDPYLEEYSPDYYNILKNNTEWDREVTTNDGTHYIYAWLRGDESLLYWNGPIVRKDLLNALGLKIPVTVAEWESMLGTFKANGVRYPLSGTSEQIFGCSFMSAFGIGEGFYENGGKVKYAPAEKEYRAFLSTMKKWYDNGWIDKEFYTQNEEVLNYKIKKGEVGAFVGSAGGTMGNCIPELSKIGGILTGVSIPVLNDGDEIFQSTRDSYYQPITSVSISADCEYPELVAEFLNYGYTEEGHMLYNFGIENISYVMEDGYPRYTELITNNPDGLTMQYAMSQYMASAYGGPFVQDKREYEQYLIYPEQKEAVNVWSKAKNTHKLPIEVNGDNLRADEDIINDHSVKESIKFILGERDLSEFDSFVEELKLLGCETVIKAKEEALQQYYKKN